VVGLDVVLHRELGLGALTRINTLWWRLTTKLNHVRPGEWQTARISGFQMIFSHLLWA